jgi:hypothetical protein
MEWACVKEVSGMITITSGLIAPVTDRSMMDTQDGTYVWEYSQEDCPDSMVQLYLGNVKVLSNSSTSYAVVFFSLTSANEHSIISRVSGFPPD